MEHHEPEEICYVITATASHGIPQNNSSVVTSNVKIWLQKSLHPADYRNAEGRQTFDTMYLKLGPQSKRRTPDCQVWSPSIYEHDMTGGYRWSYNANWRNSDSH